MASNEGDIESTQFRGNFSISPGNLTEGETGFLEVHDKTYCDKFLEFTPNFGINIDEIKIKDNTLTPTIATNLILNSKINIPDTTEASVIGDASLVLSGGIYSAKKIITNSELITDFINEKTNGNGIKISDIIITSNNISSFSNSTINILKKINISDITDSTSISTGSLVLSGGLGLAKNLNIGLSASINNNLTIGDSIFSDKIFEKTNGNGVRISNINITSSTITPVVGNTILFNNTQPSTSTTTGALVVSGGVGIGGSLYAGDIYSNGVLLTPGGGGGSYTAGTNISIVGNVISVINNPTFSGIVSISNNTASTSTTTGALVVSGGVGIGGSLFVGNTVRFTNNTTSTSATTGALVVTGGVGIGESLFVGNTVRFTNNTTSTSTTTGTLVVTGGVGIGGNLFVGGNLNISGTLSATITHSSLTGLTTGDDHTQYTLLAGRTGGQVITGGNGASNSLTLRSTSNATKGSILIDETTTSTSTITGALVVAGGIGVGEGITVNNFIDLDAVIGVSNSSSGQKLYVDSSDNLLKSRNTTGTITTYNPTTTKGDLISHNGITQIRVPVGINSQTLISDSTQTSGLVWKYPFGSFYQYSESLGASTTTSTTFQTKLTMTTGTLPVGKYIVHSYTKISSNQVNRNFEIETRINSVQIEIQTTNLTRSSQNLIYNNIDEYIITTEQALTLDIRYRVVETTQTLTISNTKIFIYRVSD